MAKVGKIEKQARIKSPPEKLFDIYKNKIDLMPKISPDKLRSIEVIEGDGKSVGSVRLWTYFLGDSVVAKDKIDAIDEVNKSITFDIISGEVTKYFSSYKATIQLVSEGQNNSVKWSVEYEKMNEQVPDPHPQLDFLITMAKEVDNYLVQNP
ncbi:Bet_v_1 domain-containing protein [Psidium guajava]|nr:Bet_v_1 domain-containing protein [Psidium guajava]